MKKLLFLLCLPVVLSAQTFSDTLSFYRPANPTPYSNGDIVCALSDSAILRFPTFYRYQGGFITGAVVSVDTASTAGSFRLWLFNDSTGFTKIGDNAAWVAPAAMIRYGLVGFIDFSLSSSGLGAGSGGAADFVTAQIPFVSLGANGLYGILTASGAYTPKLSGRVTVKLIGYALR